MSEITIVLEFLKGRKVRPAKIVGIDYNGRHWERKHIEFEDSHLKSGVIHFWRKFKVIPSSGFSYYQNDDLIFVPVYVGNDDKVICGTTGPVYMGELSIFDGVYVNGYTPYEYLEKCLVEMLNSKSKVRKLK